MICSLCGGIVTWRGPITSLTHTECERCGGRNCQVVLTEDELEPVPDGCGGSGILGGWDARTNTFFDGACPGCGDCSGEDVG